MRVSERRERVGEREGEWVRVDGREREREITDLLVLHSDQCRINPI
jgi:hypothetical protein